MSLYLRYRPKELKEVLGNESTVEALQQKIKGENIPHAFLFHGPKGNGKTTLARILAKELDIKDEDLRELDTADFRGIQSVREIRKQAQYKAISGRYRMWILDECHQLTKDAQSALLKILEDTPAHVFFVLCTTDPQKLLPTVRDRCTSFELRPLSRSQMKHLILHVSKAEKKKITKQAALQIIDDSLGHPRAALQILDQVLDVSPAQQIKIAKQTAAEQNESIALCQALLKNEGWTKIRNILSGLQEQEPESVRRHVLGYAKAVLLKSDNERAGLIMELFVEPFYDSGFPGLVFACYTVSKS